MNEVLCKNPRCDKTFIPSRKSHVYCSPACKANAQWALLRSTVISKYGGKCQCCGESRLGMLAINHVNNDGHVERSAANYNGATFYRTLRDNDLRNDLEVMCANCNASIQANAKFDGKCDHQREREKAKLQYTSDIPR